MLRAERMGVLSSAVEKTTDDSELKSSETDSPRNGGLGGARADFVANLGRRGAEMSGMLTVLADQPGSVRVRDDLRRRIHALAAGAKLLRFTTLAQQLTTAERNLEHAAQRGELTVEDLDQLRELVRDMPTLAWGQAEVLDTLAPTPSIEDTSDSNTRISRLRGEAREESPTPPPSSAIPTTILVVGPSPMADALAPVAPRGEPGGEAAFEVERTTDMTVAIDMGRALAPDVVVVDGDRTGARELIEALGADPLTDFIPVIVTGRFPKPEDAGPFLALGVAKALPKPVSPSTLRKACIEVTSTYVHRQVHKDPLGTLTLDTLGTRLAEELRRGLCDTADAKGRVAEVELGEGTEVMAALWGAVARIRDLVTIQSGGAVRFASGGPEGAMPLAPWLGEATTGQQRRGGRAGGARVSAEGTLENTTIVVADDDPAVNWFLAGILRSAGATVHEARDGAVALEKAQKLSPDLVLTDILMPHLDGFALCRALKRDVVLRDVPVILLSWKEDLLQRVRELGADADGYLRKEASAGAVVQRVREVLRQRRRVAERISGDREVRGRLDGLTTRTLIRLTCEHRPTSTVLVRDASFLYEVEIRDGRPARATRTAADGTFQRGESVLAAMLGVGAGRFVVGPTPQPGEGIAPISADLVGTLEEQLLPMIAAARAAQRLLSGAALVRADRVVIDEERLGAYVQATPEPARSLLRSLAGGASPRRMIVDGQQPARLLEDVLADAAAHGAVREIFDESGEEVLALAMGHEARRLEGKKPIVPTPVPTSTTASSRADESDDAMDVPEGSLLAEALNVDPFADEETPEPSGPRRVSTLELVVEAAEGASEAQPEALTTQPEPDEAQLDALAAELSGPAEDSDEAIDAAWDSLPMPEKEEPQADASPALAEAVEAPPADDAQLVLEPPAATPTPTPTSKSKRGRKTKRAKGAKTPTPTPAEMPPPPGLKQMLTLGSLTPPPVEALRGLERFTRKDVTPKPAPVKEVTPKPHEVTPRVPRPSAFLPPQKPAKKDSKMLLWVGFAVAGLAFAGWARWHRDSVTPEAPPPPAPEAAAAMPTPVEAPEANPAAEPQSPAPEMPAVDPRPAVDQNQVEDLPLRPTDNIKARSGLLEVVCGKSDTVYVDNKLIGSGPVVSRAFKARDEPYEVRVKLRGEERVRYVVVKKGRLARVRVAPPWSR